MIAISILRLSALETFLVSTDPSLDGTVASVCTQIELSYAIVATTLPCLKPFMAALNTNYGGTTTINTPSGTAASGSGNAYSLGSISNPSKLRVEKKERPAKLATPEKPWDNSHYNVEVHIGDRGSLGSEDSTKRIISKKTLWAVDFQNKGDENGCAV